MSFTTRGLSGSEILGHRLRQLREESGLNLETVSRELRVPAKHLEAIEQGAYDRLPGLVYARNFVRLYVRHVGLNEVAAMEKFDAEYKVITAARPAKHPLLAQRATTDAPWIQRHARAIFAIAVVLAALAFFGWQILRLFLPPQLIVSDPPNDIRTTKAQLIIKGQTAPGASVSMNNDAVEVNAAGAFQQEVDLQPGLNTIKIAAKKDRSGERVIVRQILYEVTETTPVVPVEPTNSNTNQANINSSAE